MSQIPHTTNKIHVDYTVYFYILPKNMKRVRKLSSRNSKHSKTRQAKSQEVSSFPVDSCGAILSNGKNVQTPRL